MPESLFLRIKRRARREVDQWINAWRLARLAEQIARYCPQKADARPVVFFKASSGIVQMSLNNAFHSLAALALETRGVRTAHFVCNAGMSRCVLGTDRNDPGRLPPCVACVRHTQKMYANLEKHWFNYTEQPDLAVKLRGLRIDELASFGFDELPLGALVLPSLRWVLRRHHLPDDEPTRLLMREYILSAYKVAKEFEAFLEQVKPQVVIVFNGMFFPEAAARFIALRRGIRVITHEVGLMGTSAFFTDGEATAYPIDIPPDFELNTAQNARLDAYLENRFQGQFTMAGIRFWPEMSSLDEAFLERASEFRQVVPVFTNVVFDTSQGHANTIFPHMFAWLDLILEIIQNHPETLFVIRAHPDETRPGKESRETVETWVTLHGADRLPNVIFISPTQYLSSYELINHSKFAMVYNSSIGLEAALMGAVVLCGGRARYTRYPTVFLPSSSEEYRQQAEAFLEAPEVKAPEAFRKNARRFLYYQLFRTSLPFEAYLRNTSMAGFVRIKSFDWRELSVERSPTMRAIVEGVLESKPFLLED